ncbi:MAG: RNA methyltransferase [Planctomycetota bacterium]
MQHVRHQTPRELARPRELVVVCAPLRSNVNLSRIARAAGCCGVTRIIATGRPMKLDPEVARDAAETIRLENRRTLGPVLKELRSDGYRLVALEQTTDSHDLHRFTLPRRMALVVGNERTGLTDENLALVDDAVEIPVWGLPHSYNAATAACMALYEYCRQWPDG